MSDEQRPRLTISLVTYNGLRWLPGCLASIAALKLASASEVELIVLDNASTDGSDDVLRERLGTLPWARLIESDANLGFAAGHNRVIEQAAGEFVLLLNQDVELDPEFAGYALAAFEHSHFIAAVQGRLRRLEPDGSRLEVLDTTGIEMHRDRRFVSRWHGRRDGPGTQVPGPVFGADGPAPVYRRAALLAARLPRNGGGWEVLDEDFFMYKEDVDLAWRLRRLGWEAWYEPRALAWHARGATKSTGNGISAMLRSNRVTPAWIKVLSWRNQHLMQIKNEALSDFVRDLPWILRRELLSLAFIVVADPRRLVTVRATARGIPGALRKRRYLLRLIARNVERRTAVDDAKFS